MQSYRIKCLLTLSTLSLILILYGFSRPVTGYLHSWNQITTLSMTKAIYEDAGNVFRPQVSVARTTWPSVEQGSKEMFTVYEEFPLYHFLSAYLSKATGLSLEESSRLISLVGFLLVLYSALLIGRELQPGSETFSVTWLLVSSPLLYYSSAVMSDMLMLGLGLLAIVQIFIRNRSFSGSIICGLSSLSKSYGVFFALFIVVALFFKKDFKTFLKTSLLLFVFNLPILYWHYYASTAPGFSEMGTHLWAQKVSILFSTETLLAIGAQTLKFIGVIGTLPLLGYLFFQRKSLSLPYILSFTVSVAFYLLLTSDKLSDHDYYFLPIAFPLLLLCGLGLYKLTEHSKLGFKTKLAVLILPLFIQFSLSAKRVYKAKKINPDVMHCAEVLKNESNPGDLVAYYTGIERFNSIAYYSNRKGIFVEGENFDLERYRRQGAKYFLINHRTSDISLIKPWINSQKDLSKMKLLEQTKTLIDFKGRNRECKIYGFPLLP